MGVSNRHLADFAIGLKSVFCAGCTHWSRLVISPDHLVSVPPCPVFCSGLFYKSRLSPLAT
jgi:hypothetical protein